jgi:hypothetical protein
MADRIPLVQAAGQRQQLQSADSLHGISAINGGIVFNEPGADVDHRFEGDTATHLLVTDAGLDAVQIGTTSAGTIADFRNAAGIVFNEEGADRDFRLEGDSLTHLIFVDATATTENMALLAGAAPNWQSMDRGLFIGNAETAPTGNPASGVFLYSSSGELIVRDSSGGITPLSRRFLEMTATKTANYTAVENDLVVCDCSGGSFTVTLPTSPVANDEVGVLLLADTVPNTVTISNTGAGSPAILGKGGSLGTSVVLYIENDYVRLKYLGSSIWQIVDDERTLHYAEMRGDATTGQTITHNTTTVLDFATEVADNAGLADTSTDEITIRRSGRYSVYAAAGVASGAVLQVWSLNIRKNGSNIRGAQQIPAAFSSNIVNNISSNADLAAGDVITVSCVQQSSDSSSKTILLTEATTSRLVVQEIR